MQRKSNAQCQSTLAWRHRGVVALSRMQAWHGASKSWHVLATCSQWYTVLQRSDSQLHFGGKLPSSSVSAGATDRARQQHAFFAKQLHCARTRRELALPSSAPSPVRTDQSQLFPCKRSWLSNWPTDFICGRTPSTKYECDKPVAGTFEATLWWCLCSASVSTFSTTNVISENVETKATESTETHWDRPTETHWDPLWGFDRLSSPFVEIQASGPAAVEEITCSRHFCYEISGTCLVYIVCCMLSMLGMLSMLCSVSFFAFASHSLCM